MSRAQGGVINGNMIITKASKHRRYQRMHQGIMALINPIQSQSLSWIIISDNDFFVAKLESDS